MKVHLNKYISRIPFWLWGIFLTLFIIRMILPFILLHAINWALANKLGTYDGHIQDFDLNLYRGAYKLQNLEIKKKNTQLDPILSAEEIDLSLAWRTLLNKKISADVKVSKLIVRLMDSNKDEKKQIGTDEKGWQDALDVIIPISVESFKINNSAFYFTNNDLKVPLPFKIENIDGHAEDLQSHSNKFTNSLSPFYLSGYVQGHAELKIFGKIDILAKLPRLQAHFSLVNFHPKMVNQLLLAYVPLDLTSGEISFYGEVALAKGEIDGYVNLFLHNVDVIAPSQKFLSFKHFLYEVVSAAANWILQNKNQTVSAHVPFSRHKDQLKIEYAEAFSSSLKSKKSPIKKGFENSISLKRLEKK